MKKQQHLDNKLVVIARAWGTALLVEAVATRLQVGPPVIEPVVRTLIWSGRVVDIESADSCGDCPLQRGCTGICRAGTQVRAGGARWAVRGIAPR